MLGVFESPFFIIPFHVSDLHQINNVVDCFIYHTWFFVELDLKLYFFIVQSVKETPNQIFFSRLSISTTVCPIIQHFQVCCELLYCLTVTLRSSAKFKRATSESRSLETCSSFPLQSQHKS
ncbi:hypothetical protein DPMN_127084 [Dreissena polymorpha]|uniref:Uncharacterized protein n=1 Tax=Dreissena polymorpha TaxID=45954 RepID=A0A9D4H0N6_DREPO|nr:hypothetical protein DPMN_127084 [Dreissena polymorpha]